MQSSTSMSIAAATAVDARRRAAASVERTLRSRAASNPKPHVLDSGVAGRLLRLTPDKLARQDPTALTELGHLLEPFVVGRLLEQA